MMAVSFGRTICLRCRKRRRRNLRNFDRMCSKDLERSKSAVALKKGMLGDSGKRVCQRAPAYPFWGHPEDVLNLQINYNKFAQKY